MDGGRSCSEEDAHGSGVFVAAGSYAGSHPGSSHSSAALTLPPQPQSPQAALSHCSGGGSAAAGIVASSPALRPPQPGRPDSPQGVWNADASPLHAELLLGSPLLAASSMGSPSAHWSPASSASAGTADASRDAAGVCRSSGGCLEPAAELERQDVSAGSSTAAGSPATSSSGSLPDVEPGATRAIAQPEVATPGGSAAELSSPTSEAARSLLGSSASSSAGGGASGGSVSSLGAASGGGGGGSGGGGGVPCSGISAARRREAAGSDDSFAQPPPSKRCRPSEEGGMLTQQAGAAGPSAALALHWDSQLEEMRTDAFVASALLAGDGEAASQTLLLPAPQLASSVMDAVPLQHPPCGAPGSSEHIYGGDAVFVAAVDSSPLPTLPASKSPAASVLSDAGTTAPSLCPSTSGGERVLYQDFLGHADGRSVTASSRFVVAAESVPTAAPVVRNPATGTALRSDVTMWAASKCRVPSLGCECAHRLHAVA